MSANLKNVPLPHCPLCKGGMEFLFETNDYRRPQLSEKYSVVWCARCKYGKLAGDFRPGEVSQFYEIEYYTHGANNTSETSAGLLGRIRTHVAWRFDKGSDLSPEEVGVPGRLIDIGCGGGNNMAKLRAAGFSVVGVEPDPRARSVAAKFGPVYSGTAETPPIELGCEYDYALLSHVLEHTISAATALERVHQLLAKSGKLIVEVPNCGAAGFKEFGPIWPWTDVPRHIHFFTQKSLMKTLEAAGFSIVKVLYTGFTRQFSSSWIVDLNKIHNATSGSGYSKSWLAKQSWGLLLRTAIASAHYKYDSIRIHALKV